MLKKQFLGAKIHIFEKRCSLRFNLVGTPCRTNTLCMYCQKATIANMAFSDCLPYFKGTSATACFETQEIYCEIGIVNYLVKGPISFCVLW